MFAWRCRQADIVGWNCFIAGVSLLPAMNYHGVPAINNRGVVVTGDKLIAGVK